MRSRSAVLACALLVSAAWAQSSQAATLFSDDFNATPQTLNATNFLGLWSVTQGSVDVIGVGGPYDYYPGNGSYVDLNGSTNQYGGLGTTQVFLPGTYSVSFNLGSSGGGAGGVDAASTPKLTEVCLGNSACTLISLPSLPLLWTSNVLTLTTTIAGTLSFTSLPDPNIGSGVNQYVGNILDNVVVSDASRDADFATPLPSTWLMLLGGLAGFGFLANRGTKNGRTAFASA